MSPTTTRHSRADSAQPPYRKPSLPRERAQSWSSWAQSEEDDTQSSYQHIPSHAAHSLLETTRRPSAASSTMSSSRDPSISLVSRNDSLALTPQTSHSSMAPASRTNSSSSTSISAIRSQASAHVKTGLVVNKSLDSWSKGWETAFEAKQRSRPSPQPSSSSSSSQKAHASSQLTTHPAQHIAHPARSPPNAALERRMSAAFMTPEEVSQRWYFCHSTGAATTARERWRGSRTDSLAGEFSFSVLPPSLFLLSFLISFLLSHPITPPPERH